MFDVNYLNVCVLAQAKAFFEEDLFPGEIFGEAALSGMHTRLMTAVRYTTSTSTFSLYYLLTSFTLLFLLI